MGLNTLASFSNTIKTTIDVATAGATASVKSFRQSIMDADGATGKLKAGFGAAGDFIKANAAGAAVAIGTTLVAAGAKAVAQFTDLAIEAGAVADKLGITSEAASRWMAIGDDVGVSTDSITKAMLRMEKAVGTTPEKFAELGVSIAETSTGALDANETFTRTIERLQAIEDPRERARLGNLAFGKSWADLAELLNGDVREAMANVSDAQVIDADEVAKARAYRAAMDSLQESVGDVATIVGEELTPAITAAAKALATWKDYLPDAVKWGGKLVDVMSPVDNVLDGMGRVLDEDASLLEKFAGGVETLTGALPGLGEATQFATGKLFDYKGVLGETLIAQGDLAKEEMAAAEAAKELAGETDELTTEFADAAAAARDYRSALDELFDDQVSAAEAQIAYREATRNSADAVEDYVGSVLRLNDKNKDTRTSLLDVAEALDGAESALLDQAQAAADAAEAQAAANGVTDAAAVGNAAYRDELKRLASTLAPGDPLRANLEGLLDDLNALPEDTYTTVNVDTSAAERKLAAIQAKIATMSGSRSGGPGSSTTSTGQGAFGIPTNLFQPMSIDSGITTGVTAPDAGASGPSADQILKSVEALSSAQSTYTEQTAKAIEIAREYNSQLTDANQDVDLQNDLQKKGAQAAMSAARAKVMQARAEAELQGKTLDAKDAAKLQINELAHFADHVAPGSPLMSGIKSYITLLGQVESGSADAAVSTKERTQAALDQAGADLAASRAAAAVTDATNDYVGALFMQVESAEDAAAKAQAIASAERALTDSILREADALAEQQRVASASQGIALSDAQVAAIKAQIISAEASQLQGGGVRSTLDAYASTLQGATINLTVNAGMGTDGNLVGREILDVLNRTLRQHGRPTL